jgi:DNA polymerase-3 subunit epsilon
LRLRAPPQGAAETFAKASRPGARTPWREARWCALDLELTGLDPRKDVIIAIGVVPIDDGRVLLGRSTYTLVRTSQRSEHDAVLLHKLRVADLADAPPLDEAIELVFGAMAGRVPVFHTAGIERNFLEPVFSARSVRLPAAADTEILGRLLLRESDGIAATGLPLAKLARMLGLPTGPAHHALGDALTTAAAFIALASRLDSHSPQTVGSLVRAADRLRGARRFGAG